MMIALSAVSLSVLLALGGCSEKSDLDAFRARALREIQQCLNHGRDCGTRGPHFPSPVESARLRRACREAGVLSAPELRDGAYRLTLTCRAGSMTAVYSASADLGLADELREPVVGYTIRL